MATLATQLIDLTGLEDFTLAAAAGGGDVFPNSGRTMFVINNGGGGAVIVTFDSRIDSSFGTDEDVSVSVGAGVRTTFGPFQTQRFNNTTQQVSVSYDGVDTVTVAALELDARGW